MKKTLLKFGYNLVQYIEEYNMICMIIYKLPSCTVSNFNLKEYLELIFDSKIQFIDNELVDNTIKVIIK